MSQISQFLQSSLNERANAANLIRNIFNSLGIHVTTICFGRTIVNSLLKEVCKSKGFPSFY